MPETKEIIILEKGLQGTVKWFGPARGIGFIIGPDKKEYFIHFRDINMTGYKTLTQGQKVVFDVKKVERGVAACNVTVIE